MKAGILFANTGPILVLTSCASFQEPLLLHQLAAKSITKFIAYEVPLERVAFIYGVPFEVIANDLEHTEDLRVLDFNGHHIFSRFSFDELGDSIMWGD